jgi:hypothetical protein
MELQLPELPGGEATKQVISYQLSVISPTDAVVGSSQRGWEAVDIAERFP